MQNNLEFLGTFIALLVIALFSAVLVALLLAHAAQRRENARLQREYEAAVERTKIAQRAPPLDVISQSFAETHAGLLLTRTPSGKKFVLPPRPTPAPAPTFRPGPQEHVLRATRRPIDPDIERRNRDMSDSTTGLEPMGAWLLFNHLSTQQAFKDTHPAPPPECRPDESPSPSPSYDSGSSSDSSCGSASE